jgi:hypothetical protein
MYKNDHDTGSKPLPCGRLNNVIIWLWNVITQPGINIGHERHAEGKPEEEDLQMQN